MPNDLKPIHPGEPLPRDGIEQPAPGQWYWVKNNDHDKEEYRWLGCVLEVGTNYLELRSPGEKSYHQCRVHFDEMDAELERVHDPEAVIRQYVDRHQGNVMRLMEEVRQLTARLGLRHQTSLEAPETDDDPNRNALVVVTSTVDVKKHERALVLAKDKQLPELFEKIKQESQHLSDWLTAATLPSLAQLGLLEGTIEQIEGRLFNVKLYAGLTEDVAQCAKGKTAPVDAKLHVMQRRLYMDEECLANYSAGGMEFKDIREFDKWIGKRENRDRLLPFPRTIAAFRVRRLEKERDDHGDFRSAWINFHLEQDDKTTFLYIRNGDNLWRLSCDQDFGEMLFPDLGAGEGGPMVVSRHFSDIKLMRLSEYEDCVLQWKEKHKLAREWRRTNKGKHTIDSPYGMWSGEAGSSYRINGRDFRPRDWAPLDSRSLYFDDANKKIAAEISAHNRIVLILQGLSDRSEVLHPHAPVNLAQSDSFERSVALVYDATNALYGGEKPDFEAYRERLNASITVDSLLTGQDDFWQRLEGKRETERGRANAWRFRGNYSTYEKFRPEGNPGPGVISRPAKWSKGTQRALFKWTRAKQTRYWERAPASVSVPSSMLLNVSAYKAGDFKQFFRDARTRAEYLKWAPLLLAAEDHLAAPRKREQYDKDR